MSKKKNKSKTYLLPLLAEVVPIDIRFYNNLVNTYISDANGLYKNCLFILHDFTFKDPKFTSYEHTLVENPYFIDSVDIENQVLYSILKLILRLEWTMLTMRETN